MIRFPFFSYPFPYRYYSPHYGATYQRHYNTYQPTTSQNSSSQLSSTDSSVSSSSLPFECSDSYLEKDNVSDFESRKAPSKFNPISFHFEGFFDPNQVVLEVLGLKLYLDDFVILGLLFILYQEDVKDEMLFLVLIFLLLS